MTMIDEDKVQQIKDRLADRFTAAELCELLDVPVEDIIEEYWTRIVMNRSGAFDDEFGMET